LVGHSYGGAVITGVADTVPDRVLHIVHIDTVPLNDGERLTEAFGENGVDLFYNSVVELGDGWLIAPEALRTPPPTMRKHPWKTYIERIDIPNGAKKPGTIIVATEDAEIFGYMRTVEAPKRAKARGWEVYTIEGHHPLQEASPSKEKVADILFKIAESKD
jgi:pimeloyl-ACP methyl ester carboxylesterase